MLNFNVTKEIIKEHNLNWLQIPDHPYRLSIIQKSGSKKTNSSFNLISIKSSYLLKTHIKQSMNC